MAIGDSYSTLAVLKGRLGITDTNDDAALTRALGAVSRGVERFTRRQFNKDAAPSLRIYNATSPGLVIVDDFYSTAGLIVATDSAGNGTADVTWTAGDYQPEPLNGIVHGVPGWPFWKVRAVGGARKFPSVLNRACVQITAPWGWAVVPDPVTEASLIVSEDVFKLKDIAFGIQGYAEWGYARVKENLIACEMLRPYRRRLRVGGA
jgi:hypothetical protein